MDVTDMIFSFNENAGARSLTLKGEHYKYLIKVRRHQEGDTLAFRNREALEILHTYKIVSIDGRSAQCELLNSEEAQVRPEKSLHLAWCVIDAKSVEKVLPMLNEIGVAKITFIYCERSQKNFKPDYKRYERILESSMQQCGRAFMMEFAEVNSLEAFMQTHPQTVVFDFCEATYSDDLDVDTVLIGTEGGFSEAERELLASQKMFRLDTPLVLRSETAAVAVASKVLF